MTGQASLSKRALLALEHKYTALLDMRRRRDRGGNTERAQLAALARAFPGCLRELDRNRAAGLSRRLAAVRAARTGVGPVRPWMQWIWHYHRGLTAALAARQMHEAPADGTQAQLRPALPAIGPKAGTGRLSLLVLAAVSANFGTTPERIARTLFPPRRPLHPRRKSSRLPPNG